MDTVFEAYLEDVIVALQRSFIGRFSALCFPVSVAFDFPGLMGVSDSPRAVPACIGWLPPSASVDPYVNLEIFYILSLDAIICFVWSPYLRYSFLLFKRAWRGLLLSDS